MPDSEQKIHQAVLPSSAPSPNTPWDNLAVEPSSPAIAAPPELSSEAAWNGDVNQLFADTEPTAPNHAAQAATSDTPAFAVHPPSEYSPISPSPSPHQEREINQTLARLELNSLEVKLYLDSIEEKISRMEPRLDQLQETPPTSDLLASGPPVDPPQGEPSLAPAPQIAPPTESTTDRRRRRLDLHIDGSPNSLDDRGLSPHSSLHSSNPLYDEDPWAFLPWLLARRRQLAVVAVVVIAFVTALTFSARHQPPSTTSAALPTNTPAPAPVFTVTPSKSSAAIPTLGDRTASGDPVAKTDTASAPPSVSGSPATVPSAASPEVVESASPLVPLPSTNPASDITSPAAAAPSPRAIAPDASPDREVSRTVPASGRVRVSSGVMAGNLIYSPKPHHPGGLASLFHTEGAVTLQAVIARSGRVEDLRVLSGHRLLRGAAQDAVRTWRYRPYLINGIPVEVATIITVEFHR